MEKIRSYVELFHLLFVEQLSQKLDKRLYAIKGGCNLRFFLGSIRYSEDIDIDVQKVALHTLQNNIDKILQSTTFNQILKTKDIVITSFSSPKQTLTTQRWKIQLKVPAQSILINTKIEFSRRDLIEGAIIEAISRDVISSYQLRSILVPHYTATSALEQKIKALILRSETQARDIFDLYHLIQTQKIEVTKQLTIAEKNKAIDHAMSINFPIFKAQVVSYLPVEYQSQYDDPETWNMLVETVCAFIMDCSK